MHPIIFIVFLPLLAAIVAGLGGRVIGKTAAKVVTTGSLFVGAILSWPIFLSYVAGSAEPAVVPVLKFIESGALNVDWALRVDTLTAVMLVVVTTVSSLVHLYSWGYMEEDPSQPRFFAYLSLFSFAMLFGGQLVADAFGALGKLIIYLCAAVAIVMRSSNATATSSALRPMDRTRSARNGLGGWCWTATSSFRPTDQPLTSAGKSRSAD